MQLRYRSVLLLLLIIINYGYGAADPLNIGEPLPVIQGETLEGKSLEFPAACSGKITLIVFSFTKKAGTPARQWRDRFEKEFGRNSNVKNYGVMFLEGVPALLRGFVSSGIKKGIPKDKYPFLLRVYNNEKLWKERLNALNDGEPYSVLLDGSGKVIWMSTEQVSGDQFNELLIKTKENLK
jgi:hypothetical protein